MPSIDPKQYYKIVPLHSSAKCLEVRGGPNAVADGEKLQQYDYLGKDNQKWKFIDLGTGFYEIEAKHSAKCLDVEGGQGAIADGAKIQQYGYFGTANQQWQVIDNPGGGVRIVARHSLKCLDVTGGAGAVNNGADIQQWRYWGGANQHWSLVPVEAIHLDAKRFVIDYSGAFCVNTRSYHNDSLYAGLMIRVDGELRDPIVMPVGDVNGNHGVGISNGSQGTPVFWVANATDDTKIEIAFSLMNIGHGNSDQIKHELQKFMSSAASNILGQADTIIVHDGHGHSSSAEVDPVVGALLLIVLAGAALMPLFKSIFDNCDGPVSWGKTTYTGKQLAKFISEGNGKYVQTISTKGHGCKDFEYRSDIYIARG